MLVADDFPSMQEALVSSLQSHPNLDIVGTAANGLEALEKVDSLLPDIVVADLQMPVMDGFQLMRRIHRLHPEIKLVAISGHCSPLVQQEALSAGANSFVSKDGLPHNLLSAVDKLLAL